MNHENEAVGQPEEVENSEVSTKCLTVVKQYCTNQISKGDTICKITQTILTDETEAMEPPGKTVKSYVTMLNDWDWE